MTDIRVSGSGTVYALHPVSILGWEWVDEHVCEPIRIGDMIPVEHRYISDIVEGAREDGLEVEIT
jgi:hypothetical protein